MVVEQTNRGERVRLFAPAPGQIVPEWAVSTIVANVIVAGIFIPGSGSGKGHQPPSARQVAWSRPAWRSTTYMQYIKPDVSAICCVSRAASMGCSLAAGAKGGTRCRTRG
jgi:hypothetical protein